MQGDKHEAHRHLVARLRQQAGDVRRLTSGLEEGSLARRLKPEQWSLKELVCHLWRVQQVFEGRIEAMLREETPAITRYEPEGDAEFAGLVAQPAAVSLASFLDSRTELSKRLEALTPSDWHRPGRHPDFPHFDVHFQVEYMVHHEAHHIYQMYQRRAPLRKLPH